MKPRTVVAMLTFSILSILVGCSSKPGLADGERALKERIARESEGRLQLVKFKMTRDEGTAGIDTFSWAVEGELEVTENCVWLFDQVSGTVPIDFRTAAGGGKADGRPLERGEKYSLVAALYLSKGSKGWEASAVSMRKIPRTIR